MALKVIRSKTLAQIFLALVVLATTTSMAAARFEAPAAAFSVDEDTTRFVLELSGEPSHRIFVVDKPNRMVIDLDNVTFAIEGDVTPAGLVSDWRFGALGPSTGRIVFDLAEPALVARQFVLPAMAGRSARLVLDLKRVGEERFADAARSAVAAIDAPVTRSRARADVVVVLDPGHGGVDPGAISGSGTLEKDLVLEFAKRLAARLETVPGLAVRLTRDDDRFLSLNRRIRIARAYGADLFISIHADAAPQDFVHGATVYTLSELPSDAQAAALAARENLADTVSGVVEPQLQEDVSGILADLLRKETRTFAHTFAGVMVDTMAPTVAMNSNPHRSARFRVLMAHDIPSVLLELGYLTNEADEEALLRPEWQDKAAEAIMQSIAGFFDLSTGGEGAEKAAAQPATGAASVSQ